MLNTYWKQFKSGTDIRGVASEGVAGQEINPVSYTHLDVYKRQFFHNAISQVSLVFSGENSLALCLSSVSGESFYVPVKPENHSAAEAFARSYKK